MKIKGVDPKTVKESFEELLVTETEAAILNSIFEKTYLQSTKMGWREKSVDPCRPLLLCHEELGEATHYLRTPDKDKHLPQYDGVIVELADAVIRIGDLACALGYDNLGTVIADKMKYNQTRVDHQKKNRKKKGGKKF